MIEEIFEEIQSKLQELYSRVTQLEAAPTTPSGGGGGGAPADAEYLVNSADPILTNEIVVTAARGRLICADSTPTWNTLDHPGAANKILTTDASDILWSTNSLQLDSDIILDGNSNTLTLNNDLTNSGGTLNHVAYWSGTNVLSGEAQLNLSRGGTGQDFSGIARGDIIITNSTPELDLLNIGAFGTILYSNGTDPSWTNLPGAGIAPNDATYLVVSLDAGLTQERAININNGLTFTDGGANNNYTVNLGTPSTNSYSSTNAVTATSHTHEIESTSDGDANPETILHADASGEIALTSLLIDDNILHKGDLNTSINFATDGIIFYCGGAAILNLVEGVDDYINSYVDIRMPNGGYIGRYNDVRIIFDSTSGYIDFQLDDSAGSDKVRIVDSSGTSVFDVNSDGDTESSGYGIFFDYLRTQSDLYVQEIIYTGAGDMQTIYNADAVDGFDGTIYFGNGGASLSHAGGNDGYFNTAVGKNSLYNNTTGNFNTALGYNAMYTNTTGYENIAIGILSLYYNTSGYDNVSIGYNSLLKNTSGHGNNVIGNNALGNNLTGYDNIAIGYSAGAYASGFVNNTAPTNCVFIGKGSTSGAINQAYEIVIGNSAVGHGSYTTTLGYTSTTDTYLYGDIHIENGNFIGIDSDVRIKFDSTSGYIDAILDDAAGSDKVRIVDSAGTAVTTFNSDGEIITQGQINCQNLIIDDYILHEGEVGNDTYIRLQEDQITLVAGTNTYVNIYDDTMDFVCGASSIFSIEDTGAEQFIDIYTNVWLPNQGDLGIENDVRMQFDSTSGYINLILDDTAGSDGVRVLDGSLTEKASINSCGELRLVTSNSAMSIESVASIKFGSASSVALPAVYVYSTSAAYGYYNFIKKSSAGGFTVGAYHINARDDADNPLTSGNLLRIDNDSVEKFHVDYSGSGYFAGSVTIASNANALIIGDNTSTGPVVARWNNSNHIFEWYLNDSNNFFGVYDRTNSGYRFAIDYDGYIGIGTTTPAAQLHVDQSSTTAAIPVLTLDQADLSEEFINFVSSVGTGYPIQTGSLGSYYGKVRVAVNGTFKYIALYNS